MVTGKNTTTQEQNYLTQMLVGDTLMMNLRLAKVELQDLAVLGMQHQFLNKLAKVTLKSIQLTI